MQRQQELEKLRLEQEERDAEEARKKAIEQEKLDSAHKVPEEPDPSHPESVHVVFKLPCGSRLDRRFLSSNSLEVCIRYVLKQYPKFPLSLI